MAFESSDAFLVNQLKRQGGLMVSVFDSVCCKSNTRLDWQPVQGELKYPMLHIAY